MKPKKLVNGNSDQLKFYETTKIGIIMNGVTARMGINQHGCAPSTAFINRGAVKISATETICRPQSLVGERNGFKLREGDSRFPRRRSRNTDLTERVKRPSYQSLLRRAEHARRLRRRVKQAAAPAMHVYCEKPHRDQRRRTLRALKRRLAATPASKTASSKTSSGCPA